MKILVVQESDWLKRNPHQQHHLMDRMVLRGHEVKVIDYPIDWPKEDPDGFMFKREVHDNVFKVKPEADIQVIRPSFIKKPVLNYMSLYHTHKKEIKRQIEEFKPDIIMGLGLLNAYSASKLANKHNIPFVYYLIDVLYALIPEKTFQSFGKKVNIKAIERKELAIELGKNKEKYPNMKILIVGDGDAYDKMVQIKEEYDLGDQLILTGKQPYEMIPQFLAAADFCLLPAYIDEEIMQDIVPIKLYEYLAMEKVVIATELPGISKEFGYGNGIEYVQKAEEVLETAQMILDEGRYEEISKKGREYVKSNDWEAITDKFEKALNDLIG